MFLRRYRVTAGLAAALAAMVVAGCGVTPGGSVVTVTAVSTLGGPIDASTASSATTPSVPALSSSSVPSSPVDSSGPSVGSGSETGSGGPSSDISGSGSGASGSGTSTPGTDEALRAQLLPEDRQTLWKPGVSYGGTGIPDRQTQCAQLAPSGGDDTAAIQEALNSCPADQVVQLNAGKFLINGDGIQITNSNVTLRGVGSGTPGTGDGGTQLVKADRDTSMGSVLSIGGDPRAFADSIRLSADAELNTYTAVLADNPGIDVGEFVLIDQVTTSDPDVHAGTEVAGSGDSPFNRPDRTLSQIVEVTAVDGNLLTFATPLHWTFRTRYQAEISRFGDVDNGQVQPFVRSVGIEDLFLSGGNGGQRQGNIAMRTCAYCWVARVDSTDSQGTSICLLGTYRSEVRDSYIHSSAQHAPDTGMLLVLSTGSSDNLIENNVLWNGAQNLVMRATGGGNVVGYNFLQDGFNSDDKNKPPVGLNASRATTPHMELLEGNEAFNADGDSTLGNSLDITFFRNRLTGTRLSADDLGLTDSTLRRVVGLNRYQYNYNFIGNVLGTQSMKLADGQTSFVYEVTDHPGDNSVVPMWMLGYNEQDPQQPLDPKVGQTVLRHGNFDYVTKSVIYDPNLPRELPASMYLPGKPAFFGNLAWPWVTPDSPGSRVQKLPAAQRFAEINP